MTYQPDRFATAALAMNWQRAARMAEGLAELFAAARKGENGQPGLMRGVRREALALLRRGEAIVRRMLVMIAASLPRPKVYLCASAPGIPHKADGHTARPTLKHFRLAEPEQSAVRAMRAGRLSDYTPPEAIIADSAYRAADPSTLLPATNLFARIEALSDALANPDHHAARMARWIERRRLMQAGLSRTQPLRLGAPPGWSKRWHTRNADVAALGDMDSFAREAFEAWDTS